MTKLRSGNAAAAAGMSVAKAESPRPLWTLRQLSPGLMLRCFR